MISLSKQQDLSFQNWLPKERKDPLQSEWWILFVHRSRVKANATRKIRWALININDGKLRKIALLGHKRNLKIWILLIKQQWEKVNSWLRPLLNVDGYKTLKLWAIEPKILRWSQRKVFALAPVRYHDPTSNQRDKSTLFLTTTSVKEVSCLVSLKRRLEHWCVLHLP